MSGNTASRNTFFGFGFALPIGETFNFGTFDDNTATNNGTSGFRVDNLGGGTSSGNVSSGNGAADVGDVPP